MPWSYLGETKLGEDRIIDRRGLSTVIRLDKIVRAFSYAGLPYGVFLSPTLLPQSGLICQHPASNRCSREET